MWEPGDFFDKDRNVPTNADHIRGMSDEGLADIIADNILTGACNDFGIPWKNPCPRNCKECVLEWLKKPVGVE